MTAAEAKWARIRMAVLFFVFVLACGSVLWRAFNLQFLEREKLVKIAEAECHRVINLHSVRGSILDRNGEKLAVSLEADSIFAQPSELENPVKTAAILAKTLNLNKRRLTKKLSSGGTFTWIKRQVSPKEAEKIKALDIKGIYFLGEHKRFYPNKLLAGHMLGFVGVDSVGLEGLELAYDEYLQGGEERWRVRRDALGRIFLDPDTGYPQKGKGADIILTIDRRIQYVTEKALAKAVETYNAKSGAALVVRPQTGEILASAVAPGFNSNVFRNYSAAERRNRIVTDTFDPGSTFKVFVVAAALEEGLVKPLDMVFCENGAIKLANHVIHDTKPHGWLTVNKVIKYSSNIGSAKIGEKLGPKKLHYYLTRFNFGEKTGIDFPVESSGLLRDYKNWHVLDMANVAFGQGLTVTAMQMAAAMSALANDGMLMKPYLVSKIVDENGRTILKNEPRFVRQVVSSETAAEVNAMLRMVVTEGGTGTLAEPIGYPAAGKTGTAQKLDPVSKSYSNEKYFSSFLGMVPYNDPKLVIFVGLDEPGPKRYGGTVAAPVFREIAEQVLPMLNVPPVPASPGQEPLDEKNPAINIPAPEAVPEKPVIKSCSYDSNDSSGVRNFVHRPITLPPDEPVGETENEARIAGASSRQADTVMPDLTGLSMRRVLERMAKYDVNITFKGSGQAVWQMPSPGENIEAGQVCQVKFEQW